jgi:hypothetical protein
MVLPLFLTALAICGVAIGVRLGGERRVPAQVTAAGGALLFGIALFWVLPEMAEQSGWAIGTGALFLGAIALWAIDHFLYPIWMAGAFESFSPTRLPGGPLL